jgi:hypothetical protein
VVTVTSHRDCITNIEYECLLWITCAWQWRTLRLTGHEAVGPMASKSDVLLLVCERASIMCTVAGRVHTSSAGSTRVLGCAASCVCCLQAAPAAEDGNERASTAADRESNGCRMFRRSSRPSSRHARPHLQPPQLSSCSSALPMGWGARRNEVAGAAVALSCWTDALSIRVRAAPQSTASAQPRPSKLSST